MADEKNPYGYDIVNDVPTSGGRYLSFGKNDKGRIIQIRVVSEPRYVLQHWLTTSDGKRTTFNCKGEACPYCGKEVPPKEKIKKDAKWGWIAIDREDGQVKVFSGTTGIALSIKSLTELRSKTTKELVWGDPTTFDVQIERTEEPGPSYYRVTALPEGKGPITEEEKAKVQEANFNLEEELAESKKSEHVGSYGTGEMETAPDAPIDVPEDLGGEGKKEDLPF